VATRKHLIENTLGHVVKQPSEARYLWPEAVIERRAVVLSSQNWTERLYKTSASDEEKTQVFYLTNTALVLFRDYRMSPREVKKAGILMWLKNKSCNVCRGYCGLKFSKEHVDMRLIDYDHKLGIKNFGISDGIEKISAPFDALFYEAVVLTRPVSVSCHRCFSRLQAQKIVEDGGYIPSEYFHLLGRYNGKGL
jgi:hypothetical protein